MLGIPGNQQIPGMASSTYPRREPTHSGGLDPAPVASESLEPYPRAATRAYYLAHAPVQAPQRSSS
jgi:hypothetical protein